MPKLFQYNGKAWVQIAKDGKTPTKTELMRLIKPLIPAPIPAKDGKPADEEKIKDKIEKDLPQLGEPIRDSLELLEGDERLDVDAIKGIKKLVKAEGGTRQFVAGGRAGTAIILETPTGAINGTNKAFILGKAPKNLLFFVNGQSQILTTNYTLSNKTVTLTVAPATNESVLAFYTYI